MNDFINWFRRNQYEIGWFLVGFMSMEGIHSLQRGDTVGALIDFGFAYLNYRLVKN